MAKLKPKQIDGFVNSQQVDFSRTGASDVEFPSERGIAQNFVRITDFREEAINNRPTNAASPTQADRQITTTSTIRTLTGNVNEDVEVFVNGLKVSVDSFNSNTITLSQLAYDVDSTDDLTVKYVRG